MGYLIIFLVDAGLSLHGACRARGKKRQKSAHTKDTKPGRANFYPLGANCPFSDNRNEMEHRNVKETVGGDKRRESDRESHCPEA